MTTGKLLILIGVVSIGTGLMISYTPWLFNWFGKLPGDIRIEDKNRYKYTYYFNVTRQYCHFPANSFILA